MRFWCALVLAAMAAMGPAAAARLTIHIEHVSPKGGLISLALYTAENYGDDEHPTASRDVEAKFPRTTIVIDGIAPGIYAIKAFQDILRSGKFQSNSLGLPLEPYGFSNDAEPLLGEPGFDRTRFTAGSGNTEITIHLSSTDGIDLPARRGPGGP